MKVLSIRSKVVLLAVLALPPHVDVARFDILPSRQGLPTGTKEK